MEVLLQPQVPVVSSKMKLDLQPVQNVLEVQVSQPDAQSTQVLSASIQAV